MTTNTAWTVCNRKLLKDGTLFFVRGIDYQPTPVGQWSGLDLLLQSSIWARDLPLMRNLNANAIKVYDYKPGQAAAHLAFLDAAYNRGYNPLYVMFSVWVPPSFMSGSVALSNPYFQTYVAAYLAMASEVACHPGTMGFVIGGEINLDPDVATPLFWQKFNALAQAVRTGMAIAGCKTQSIKVLTTNFIEDDGRSIAFGEQYGAAVDLWGITVYNNQFPATKIQKLASKTSRPIVFAEYGVPYASNSYAVYDQTLWNVESYLMSMATLLEANYMARDGSNTPLLVGGFVFEYSDEWWKMGNPAVQDMGIIPGSFLPLGYFSEEHFGIFAVAPTGGASSPRESCIAVVGLDFMIPRTVATRLSTLWSMKIDAQPFTCSNPGAVAFPTPATAVADCNVSSADLALGISVYSDIICTQSTGAMGCRNGACRLCQLFPTQQSAPYVGCPPPAIPPASACASPTQLCANGMALLANSSCQFDSCPAPVCTVDAYNVQQGLGSIFDPECITDIQADGCDVYNRGCRLCRQPESLNTVYRDCPVVARAPSAPATICMVTQSDLNVGIDVVFNAACSGVGGVGCDPRRANCQFCQFRTTSRSVNLLPCPGANISSTHATLLAADATNSPPASTLLGVVVVVVVVAVMATVAMGSKALQMRLARRSSTCGQQITVQTPRGPHIL
ncbi:glycoside hydrolase [Achlya hypogyna]|uniref:Glycoside hydrolase n=1 Tax=Achlya hypogyna TaxID=1202772 RepID=A0A1V9YUS4_ACHHY|nr:glycoside hydrolase [Achlya hypogyna]